MDPFAFSNILSFISHKLEQLYGKNSGDQTSQTQKLMKKGEDHINSDHVRKFVHDKTSISGYVDPSFGKVKTKHSMKIEVSYSVQITYDGKTGLLDAQCSCPRGKSICSHMIALMLFSQKMLSRTDFTSNWNRPGKSLDLSKPIQELWNQKFRKAFDAPVDKSDIAFMKNLCDKKKQFGLNWLLKVPETSPNITPSNHLTPIRTLLMSHSCMKSMCKKAWILCAIKLNAHQIEEVNKRTIGQSNNSLWAQLRDCRITASNFGIILNQMNIQLVSKVYRFPPSFFKRLLGMYDLSQVQATNWGLSHEKDAIEEYEQKTNQIVCPAGLYLQENGFIGASPDGLVGEDKIVEVKCPWSKKHASLQEALKDKNFFIFKSGEDTYCLKKDHDYYHQIQGTLYVTNRT